jgi:diguanylate cyclase (GGDEF)-like protein
LLERRSLPVEIAEDLRLRLAARPFDTDKGRITLTFSIGVGEANPGDSVDQLLARADGALYNAKLRGRNRVVGANAGIVAQSMVARHGIARAAV